MATYQHENLAGGRWGQMSLAEQMANIGSEVTRALHWKRKDNEKYCLKSVDRALELISLSLNVTTVFPHLKEIARLREAVADYFYGSNEFRFTEQSWEKYFYHFSIVARRVVSGK